MSDRAPWADRRDPITAAVESRTARVSPGEIVLMLAVAARSPVVAANAGRIEQSHFQPGTEAPFILFWRAARAVALKHGGVVPLDPAQAKEIVGLRCAQEAANDPEEVFYTARVKQTVMAPGGLLDEAFALCLGDAMEREATAIMVRFLTERAAYEPLRRALAGLAPGEMPQDIGRVAGELHRHATELAGLGADPGADAVVDVIDFRPPGAAVFTTGAPWLDAMMGGGQAGREAYVILGMTGAGKTSMGVQIALASARNQASLAPQIGADMAGHWYYFTYELTEDQLRERVYSFGAMIDRRTLNNKKDPLSTAADPASIKPYERDILVNSPDNEVRGERERIAALNASMSGANSYLHLVDYSGTHAGQGLGGVDEVAAYLSRERNRRRRIGGVVIDYAGISLERHVNHRRLDPKAIYPLLAAYVDAIRTYVAINFDCPVWVLHQFHGDSTRRSSGARMHHSEAKGSRNFADNADYAFGLPKYNETTGLLTLSMTKSRRSPGVEDGVILKYDGRFGLFFQPEQEYVVDPFSGKIVPRGFVDRVAVGPAGRPRGPIDPAAGL